MNVQRYGFGVHSPHFGPSPSGNYVKAEDFDRILAERDALQLRLNAVEEENDRLRQQVKCPAKHHHGEPVALPARKSYEESFSVHGQGQIMGWNDCLDEIAKLGPLYTHADPAEIESIKADKQAYAQNAIDLRAQLVTETARADAAVGDANDAERKLAEAHALLREVAPIHHELPEGLRERIEIALSASAEPSAPVIHPINMKTMMQAYEKVDHKALLHGTSNWCAAMATSLRGVLQAETSAPVEIDERAPCAHSWQEWPDDFSTVLRCINCGVRDDGTARAALEHKS